jgi:LPS-assembly protein
MMLRRGLQVRNDFRYLQPDYRGEIAYEALPNDRLADSSRQLFKLKHTQTLWNGWTAAVDATKVSDDRYFSDLSSSVGLTSQTTLARQLSLSRGGVWGDGGTYGFSALAQGWQTLQTDPLVPLPIPYSRKPQLSLTAQRLDTLGGDLNFEGSYTQFDHPTLVRGKRILAYPSLTLPLQTAAMYFTPKVGLHMTRYFIDAKTSTLPDASRVLPILSTTTGLNFERNTKLFGNAYTQTLEPTAYYVYIPNRKQDNLPNFESGLQDINFTTIFSENQFSGSDRINDANQLTIGVRSRLIQPDTGIELLRAGLAQRYYFKPQEVTVPGVPPRSNQSSRSDLLAALSGTIAPHLTTDFGWQFNTDERRTARSNIALRYQPQQGKLLNLAYRQNVSTNIRQIDLSGQWPVFNRWNTVGRWNYSTQDRRMLEGLAGLEYDGGCYVFRIGVHRVSTATARSNSTFFLELELNGLSSVGSNSLDLLRRNIPGYWRTDPRAARPNEYVVPDR